jgi:hypothetical protein
MDSPKGASYPLQALCNFADPHQGATPASFAKYRDGNRIRGRQKIKRGGQ